MAPIPDAQAGRDPDDDVVYHRCPLCRTSYPSARALSLHEPFCPQAEADDKDRVIANLRQQLDFALRENEALRRAIYSSPII